MYTYTYHQQLWQTIAEHINRVVNQKFVIEAKYAVVGGSINETWRIEGNGQNYFVKLNSAENAYEMFCAEAEGLMELAKPVALRVPVPFCWGKAFNIGYLVMEYLALRDSMSGSDPVAAKLGEQLAIQHHFCKVPFGWEKDNYIGLNVQINQLQNNWVLFWQQQRLGYQLDLAVKKGYLSLQVSGYSLLEKVPEFFIGYTPSSCLLHGDLWSGNFSANNFNEPVIFDPAIYYGDREVDIAMTELFGGFSASFYAAYQSVYPLDAGYNVRKKLYNLYHILNHLNLFGGGYRSAAEQLIAELLSELY